MGFGKDGKGAILRSDHLISLGTLAARASILLTGSITLGEDFRVIKTEHFAQLVGGTTDESILIGLADGELTTTEINSTLLLNGPTDRNDRDQVDQAMFPVWPLFMIGRDHPDPNNGMPIEKTLRWTFSNPEGWNLFAFNLSSGSLTTGSSIFVIEKAFGVWVT